MFRSKRTFRHVNGEFASGPGKSLTTRGTISDSVASVCDGRDRVLLGIHTGWHSLEQRHLQRALRPARASLRSRGSLSVM